MKGDVEKKERFSFAFFEDRIRFAFLSLSLSLSPPKSEANNFLDFVSEILTKILPWAVSSPFETKKKQRKKKEEYKQKIKQTNGILWFKNDPQECWSSINSTMDSEIITTAVKISNPPSAIPLE